MTTLRAKAFDADRKLVISLDGPAASGKGTISKLLAAKLKLTYFQSGLVYRNLALSCINNQIVPTDIEAVIRLSQTPRYEETDELFEENVGIVASQIATIGAVRSNLSGYLVKLIESTPRIIMEGRDIGTVIAPSADLKIFIAADINVRAARRYKELSEKGSQYVFDDILSQLKIRDQRDAEREVAPLRPPKDALEIDTTILSPVEVVNKIMKYAFLL
ncbi:Cytidylate kinase [Pseudolycoriella hygida]|uniref:(d)CMP kinase n=1 Tax=Pseudolycoriella hygida TaxID=35572 RepID=A0A9Q0N818_9DIPT|nr:Cytidylate kinase [Pseudolycoriella hygida]